MTELREHADFLTRALEKQSRKLHYSKFAKGHFYNVLPALPSKTYFQTSGISMLEINSEMQSESFIIFPFSTFSTHALEYEYP